MRSRRRSVQTFQRRGLGNSGRSSVGSCLACGQMSGKAAKKLPSNALDLEKMLHFSQQLYAHALTLQEVIRNEGEVTYEVLRPKYDRQAAQQFEVFYHTFRRRAALRKRGAGSRES